MLHELTLWEEIWEEMKIRSWHKWWQMLASVIYLKCRPKQYLSTGLNVLLSTLAQSLLLLSYSGLRWASRREANTAYWKEKVLCILNRLPKPTDQTCSDVNRLAQQHWLEEICSTCSGPTGSIALIALEQPLPTRCGRRLVAIQRRKVIRKVMPFV